MTERYRVKKKTRINPTQIKNTKINEIGKRKRDLLKRINYRHTFTVLVLPGLCVLYLLNYAETIIPQNSTTLWFSVFYFNFTILAFTSGYHKFFTHNTFVTNLKILQYYFGIFGSAIGLGSINWWSTLHRAHHQFTGDTERDPYSIKRGFYYSHLGWLIKRPKVEAFYNELFDNEYDGDKITNDTYSDMMNDNEEDLNEIELVEDDLQQLHKHQEIKRNDYLNELKAFKAWQDTYYFPLFILTTIVIPGLVSIFYCEDTFINGVIYPGILRMTLAQQCLLSTESICHFGEIHVSFPTQPFNDSNSSVNCNNPLISLLTYGQAKQNFHHEFPHDYRNDSSYLSFDPTKWFLYSLSLVGIITDLSTTPKDLITQLRIQQRQKVLNRLRSKLNWGTPISKLPLITPSEFKRLLSTSAHKDRIYIVISNIIHDITPFMDQHPGGLPLLKASHGKDATQAFFGGVYSHSTAAQNLLATMRIGYLDLGNQEEVWKKIVKEEGEVNEDHKQYNSAEAA